MNGLFPAIPGSCSSHSASGAADQGWVARALTNSFSGIAPVDVPMFIVAQFAGALAGLVTMRWFFVTSIRLRIIG